MDDQLILMFLCLSSLASVRKISQLLCQRSRPNLLSYYGKPASKPPQCNLVVCTCSLRWYLVHCRCHRHVKLILDSLNFIALPVHTALQSTDASLLQLKIEAWCSFPLYFSCSAQLNAYINTVASD